MCIRDRSSPGRHTSRSGLSAMPPRHRSRSPRPAPAEQGRRLRAEQPAGQSLSQAGFPEEARAVALADRAAF
eukprot:13989453-Alexandrium_andersonii.AAC.1